MERNVSRTVLPAEHPQLLAEARPFESDEGPMRLPDPLATQGPVADVASAARSTPAGMAAPLCCLFGFALRLDAERRALRDANQWSTAQVPTSWCGRALAAVEHGQVIHRSSEDACINPQVITCRRCRAVAVVADLSLMFATLDSLMPLMTASSPNPP
jgi:hypothetical protein